VIKNNNNITIIIVKWRQRMKIMTKMIKLSDQFGRLWGERERVRRGHVLMCGSWLLSWWWGGYRGRSTLVVVLRGSGVTGKGSRRCCWTPCNWTLHRQLVLERRHPGPAASIPGKAGTPASLVRRICSRVSAPSHLRQHWKNHVTRDVLQ